MASFLLKIYENNEYKISTMSADNIKEKDQNGQEEAIEEETAETTEQASETEQESQEEEKDEKESLIEQLEKELADTKDSLLRKAAELENVRKRVQRERVALYEEAKVAALSDFLPISEDMKRTLDAADASNIEDSFLDGVKLVANKFEEVLNKSGVERIDETGVPFDVNLHDAMLKQPAPDDKTGSDTILQVLESGYRIGNRVIRHAKVIVSE
jgi:molecular chaperone GrpE